MLPPVSQIGPITPEERRALMDGSVVAGVYETAVDRESAFERLRQRTGSGVDAGGGAPPIAGGPPAPSATGGGLLGGLSDLLFGTTGPRGGGHDGVVGSLAKSAARTVGTAVARELVRGVLGSLLGGGRR